jgi:hypothetical protein
MSKKKDNDFKKYGVDLEKEYKETQRKLKNLEDKILKRAELLQKLQPNMIVFGVKASKWGTMKMMGIGSQLEFIQEIEKQYVDQSKQTEIKF